MLNNKKIYQKLITEIKKFDSGNNEFSSQIEKRIKKAVSSNTPVIFVCFTCSNINSEYLFSNTPWNYINLNVPGNNLEPDLPRLKLIVSKLQKIYEPVKLIVLIGNTDPYYIYLRQFKDFSLPQQKELWMKFSKRWSKYKSNLEQWLKQKLGLPNLEVISWYKLEKNLESKFNISFEHEFEDVKKDIFSYFPKKDLKWELSRLKQQFGPGKYFEKLPSPNEKLLQEWVVRKFAEYAVQGKWLYEHFPNAILIQNEKPSELRSRMYQSLIKEKYGDKLSVVYFFGVDNSGFR